MIYRHSKDAAVAAAKSGFSRATGYRIEDDPRLPSHKKAPPCHGAHPLQILPLPRLGDFPSTRQLIGTKSELNTSHSRRQLTECGYLI